MFLDIIRLFNSFGYVNEFDNCFNFQTDNDCINNIDCKWCNYTGSPQCYNYNNCENNSSELMACKFKYNTDICTIQNLLTILVILGFLLCSFYILSLTIINLFKLTINPSLLVVIFIFPGLILVSISELYFIYYTFTSFILCLGLVIIFSICNICI